MLSKLATQSFNILRLIARNPNFLQTKVPYFNVLWLSRQSRLSQLHEVICIYVFRHTILSCLIIMSSVIKLLNWPFGCFLANSSMFPNPFLLAVLLSHSCRRSPPGHSALALSQYKVICLRMFFTLCSVLQNTQLSFLSMIQSLRSWSLRSTISE